MAYSKQTVPSRNGLEQANGVDLSQRFEAAIGHMSACSSQLLEADLSAYLP